MACISGHLDKEYVWEGKVLNLVVIIRKEGTFFEYFTVYTIKVLSELRFQEMTNFNKLNILLN